MPTDSFRALRKWCIENPSRSGSILTTELRDQIAEAYWFIEIRGLRDRIIHKQSDAAVRLMAPPSEIVFVTLKGQASEFYEGPNAFQYNGWIYFRCHAGYYLGRLIYLLNQVCAMAAERLNISLAEEYWATDRLPVLNGCIDYAINSLLSEYPVSREIRLHYLENTAVNACSQHRKIVERAYFLWQSSGQKTGNEVSDWLSAETAQLRWLDS